MIDFVQVWSEKTELPVERFIGWIGIARGKFFDWRKRYGKANEHNALVPRDHWLTVEEQQAIIAFHERFPLEGYRRLTFMMIDQNVVAASPSSVYRVLARGGVLDRWNRKPSKKGTGFVQPLRPHEHWHIDIAYLNLAGTFYYLCSILDGASRAVVHWEIREAMTEADVECILLRALEAFPDERPYPLGPGLAASAAVGLISSLFGIGGGIVHVPVLVLVLGFPTHVAGATSQFVLVLTAFAGGAIHAVRGDLAGHWLQAGLLAGGAVVGARLGARISHRISGATILRVLAVALLGVAARMLWR